MGCIISLRKDKDQAQLKSMVQAEEWFKRSWAQGSIW